MKMRISSFHQGRRGVGANVAIPGPRGAASRAYGAARAVGGTEVAGRRTVARFSPAGTRLQ